MLISKKNLVKIALATSISSMLYSSRLDLFAQLPETISEQKHAFVTLDDLIQDATLLEQYSPLTISGPYNTFKINENDEIVVEQDFILQSQTFVKDKMSLLFNNRTNSRNFLGTVADVIHYLKQNNISNHELVEYVSSFQAIKEHLFDGQLHMVRFQDFRLVAPCDKNRLDELIEQGIIARNPDYYFLPEHLHSQINEELLNAKILDKDASFQKKIFSICVLLSNIIDYDSHLNPTFINKSIEEARKQGKVDCKEATQYITQIYNSLLKPENNQFKNTYALPTVFMYNQDQMTYTHAVVLFINTQNNTMTLFDPSKIMQVQKEITQLKQQIQYASPDERYTLEQKITSIHARNPHDCSTYSFKARKNNH